MSLPRWKQIADHISQKIDRGSLVPGDLLPSEIDLAAQWQVSRMTAHHAMQDLQQRGIVLRKRRVGTVVATPQKRPLGYVAVFLNTRDSLEQEYLTGIRAGLPDEYDLLFCDIRCDPQREAQYLKRMEGSADGILCIPTCDPSNNELFNRRLQAEAPIVCVDCVPDGLNVDAILSDNFGVSLEAMQFLAAQGHRRIAHFTTQCMVLSSLRERHAAYQQVMTEMGYPDTRSWVRKFPHDLELDACALLQSVSDALFTLMHQPDPPTAIFCVHDYLLAAVLRACQEIGVCIPDDLEIVSFNDCPPVVPFLPGHIHRIVQPAREIGRVAAERLRRRMQGEALPPEIIRVAPAFLAARTGATTLSSMASPRSPL